MMWLIIGVVVGMGIASMWTASRSGRFSVRWYQWILGLLAIAFLLLAVQNYYGLLDELQPKMANFALFAFGVPGVTLALLTVGLPVVLGRNRRSQGSDAKIKSA